MAKARPRPRPAPVMTTRRPDKLPWEKIVISHPWCSQVLSIPKYLYTTYKKMEDHYTRCGGIASYRASANWRLYEDDALSVHERGHYSRRNQRVSSAPCQRTWPAAGAPRAWVIESDKTAS